MTKEQLKKIDNLENIPSESCSTKSLEDAETLTSSSTEKEKASLFLCFMDLANLVGPSIEAIKNMRSSTKQLTEMTQLLDANFGCSNGTDCIDKYCSTDTPQRRSGACETLLGAYLYKRPELLHISDEVDTSLSRPKEVTDNILQNVSSISNIVIENNQKQSDKLAKEVAESDIQNSTSREVVEDLVKKAISNSNLSQSTSVSIDRLVQDVIFEVEVILQTFETFETLDKLFISNIVNQTIEERNQQTLKDAQDLLNDKDSNDIVSITFIINKGKDELSGIVNGLRKLLNLPLTWK